MFYSLNWIAPLLDVQAQKAWKVTGITEQNEMMDKMQLKKSSK